MCDARDEAPDALFFCQLLLPIHDATKHTIDDDPRKPCCPHAAECTEVHAITELKTRGSGVGHSFKETSPAEILHWDGMLVFDGVSGGSHGGMLRRFDRSRPDNSCCNRHISDCMAASRWLEIKRSIKLNNNLTAFERGEDGHNPTCECDCTFDVVVHNTNALTSKAGLDLFGDESTWLFGGWGDAGSGVIKNNLEKPGGSKGGQTVLVADVDRI